MQLGQLGLLILISISITLGSAAFYQGEIMQEHQNAENSTVYVSEWKSDEWVKEDSFNARNASSKIVEVNRYPNEEPTEKQIENAWKLYNQTYENAEKEGWFDIMEAARDGYYNWRRGQIHFPNNQYIFDNHTLNPERPEFLIYKNRKNSPKVELVGVMYTTQEKDIHGAQIGGPITVWHYHPTRHRCYAGNVFPVKISNSKNCVYGEMGYKTPEMIHIWFVDRPKGQFATSMGLNRDLVNGKPEKLSRKEFTRSIEARY